MDSLGGDVGGGGPVDRWVLNVLDSDLVREVEDHATPSFLFFLGGSPLLVKSSECEAGLA